MVISNVNQVVYQGDGVTTAFPFTFTITDSTEVYLQLVHEDETVTAITQDFYVDVTNNTVHYPGYAPGSEPPEVNRPPKVQTGEKLVIYRDVPMTQEINLGDKWPFTQIEFGLDKLTMICQQIYSYTNRKLDAALASMFQLAGIVTDSNKLQHITDQYNAIDANAAAAAESEENAAASATAAANSATSAANSASSAQTTATALTNYIATKETLTAPAVDTTLSVSGAAADAKVTGGIRNVLSNYGFQRKNFTILSGSSSSPSVNQIVMNIPQGQYFHSKVTFSGTTPSNVRIYYYFADGTNTYWTTKNKYTTATKDIVAVGLYTSNSSETIEATFEVEFGLGTVLLDLPALEEIFGIYGKKFTINAGSGHSSDNDIIFINIPQGKKVVVDVGFSPNNSNTVQIHFYFTDGTSTYYTTRYKEYVASKDIKAIGVYVTTVSETTESTIKVGFGLGYSITQLDKFIADRNVLPLNGTAFTIKSGKIHSSDSDIVPVNIPAGMMFTVDAQSDVNVNTIYVKYADGTEGNLGQYQNRRTAIAAKDIAGIGLYYTTVSEDTDVVCTVYYGLLVDQTTAQFNSDKAKSFTALFDGVSDCDTFFFFSDPHFLDRHYLSLQYVAYLRRNFNILKAYASEVFPATILCGGDLLNDSDTKAEACLKLREYTGITHDYLNAFNFHTLLGNHDTNYQGAEQLSQATLDNLMFFNEDTKKAYFSYKTSETKYLCLDTGVDHSPNMTNYRWEQMYWLANELLQNTMSHVIVAMHIFSDQGGENFGTDNLQMTTNTLAIITAFNNRTSVTINGNMYDFTNATGTVHCILCGHVHQDIVYTATDNLPVITVTKATANATTDIKFDMGFLDYTNGTLYLYRINGDEPDRTVTLR